MTDQLTFTTGFLTRDLSFGRGYRTVAPQPSPAPGAAFTVKVPGNKVWRVNALQATLVTSATVSNRNLRYAVLNPDGVEVFRASANASVAASSTTIVQFAVGLGSAYGASDGSIVVPIPDLFWEAGFQIQVAAANLQAGDQIQGVQLVVEELIIGPDGYPRGKVPASPLLET